MPSAFAAAAHSFGAAKFGFLPALGIRHVRVSVRESDLRCVEAARRVPERLRDCDVIVEWRAVDEALSADRKSKCGARRTLRARRFFESVLWGETRSWDTI